MSKEKRVTWWKMFSHQRAVMECTDDTDSLSESLAGSVLAGQLAAESFGFLMEKIGELVQWVLNLNEATEEYRVAQAKLNTAFEAAGYSADVANQAFSSFYGILGDIDTAAEASQLLASLARSEEDVAKWTQIAAGVYGTFGDALPIEGLIEAATAKRPPRCKRGRKESGPAPGPGAGEAGQDLSAQRPDVRRPL